MNYENYSFRIMMGHKHLNPKDIPLALDPIVHNLIAKLHATKLFFYSITCLVVVNNPWSDSYDILV